jgi:transposase
LVYQGFTQPEVARRTGYSERRIQRMMRAMREKVWAYLHDEQTLAIGPDSEQRRYAETLQAATNRDAPWTEKEDIVLMELTDSPAHELALILGRTLWAVRHRRSRLRKREGLAP